MNDSAIEQAKATLVDIVRDKILTMTQEMPSSFGKLSEAAQRAHIEKCANVATACVQVSCDIIAADGRTVLDCTIGKIDVNETTYTGKISIPIDAEDSDTFVHAHHGPAKIAFVNTRKHLEEGTRPEPEPDQRQMFDEDNPKAVGDRLPKKQSVGTRASRRKETKTAAPKPAELPKSETVPESMAQELD